jgi:general secretion pathway protein K
MMPKPSNQTNLNHRQAGVALVIVIWILSLLTLMAGSFAMSMRRESSVSMAIIDSAKALAIAESGIILAEYNLSQPDAEQRWVADGSIYEMIRPNGVLRVRVFSESGKVDINASTETQLVAVVSAVTDDSWEQQRLVNAILDWRDADDDTRTLGAERKQYQQARLAYEPSNNAFQSLEELQLVLGMNEVIYNTLQPWLTIYSGEAEVNQDQAAPELLTVLAKDMERRHISDEALQKRLNARNEEGQDSQDDEETDNGDAAFVSENQTYTIIAEVKIEDEATAGLEVVVKYQENESGSPFEILDLKQYLQGLSLFDGAMDHLVITVQDEFRYDDSH